jgi:GMC oxidoreductase
MPRVTGLGHVGIYVREPRADGRLLPRLPRHADHQQNWRAGVVFLSADPESVDHEIALMRGRPAADEARLIQQISMRVTSLDDLRAFRRRLVAEGYRIEGVVNHASAIGCYFVDPDGNRTEVFWVTGRPCWVPTANPIDIKQSVHGSRHRAVTSHTRTPAASGAPRADGTADGTAKRRAGLCPVSLARSGMNDDERHPRLTQCGQGGLAHRGAAPARHSYPIRKEDTVTSTKHNEGFQRKDFDFVVVGAGTAGCVIAARLSEDAGARVLLLEAGGREPLAAVATPALWPTLAGTTADWASTSVLQAATGTVIPWPRGRGLGGSSAINGMCFTRGHRSSYDAWVTVGAKG